MHRIRKCAAALFLVLAVASIVAMAPPAEARAVVGGAASAAQRTSVVGALAAAGCGLGIRNAPWVIGVGGVGMTAAVIGLCVLALMDAVD